MLMSEGRGSERFEGMNGGVRERMRKLLFVRGWEGLGEDMGKGLGKEFVLNLFWGRDVGGRIEWDG